MTLMSCHHQETLRRAAWKPAGGEFDSLTEKIEWQFNDYAPYDSIARSIERMESIVNSDSTNRRLRMSRVLYWKARYNKRIENSVKSMEYITKAIQLNDSTNYEYDRLKFLTLFYTQCDTIDGGKQYKLYEYCLEYAKKIKDKSFESYSAIIMGNLLNEINENDKALHFFNLADSLNQQIGYYKLIEKNSTNGFHEKQFIDCLEANGKSRFIVTGDCTDICVLQFCLSLKTYFTQRNLQSEIIIPLNCVETYDAPYHEAGFMSLAAYKILKDSGIKFVSEIL